MKIFSHCLLCALPILVSAVVTSYFIPIDQHWQGTPVQLRHHGYVLLNHVIKTLNVFFIECLEACQNNMHCFSFNYVKLSSSAFQCELNRSTKNQSSKSYIPKPDWQYVEPKGKKLCQNGNCLNKDALPDGWYRLDASKYRLFSRRETWQDAKKYCQTLGGDLLSVSSKLEQVFLTGLFELRPTLAKYSMDGTDENLSLFEDASIQRIDNTFALSLDGKKKYARVPKFDISKSDFTMAIWIRCRPDSSSKPKRVIFNYPSQSIRLSVSKSSLIVEFYFNSKYIVEKELSISSFLDFWFHVAVTWNRVTRQINIYVNGTHMEKITAESSDLQQKESDFTLGRGRIKGYHFKGWMRELLVVPKEISPQQISLIKDEKLYFGGVWSGLNDNTAEGKFTWSNGAQPVYLPAIVSNKNHNDCVMLRKTSDFLTQWQAANCDAKKGFVCKIPCP